MIVQFGIGIFPHILFIPFIFIPCVDFDFACAINNICFAKREIFDWKTKSKPAAHAYLSGCSRASCSVVVLILFTGAAIQLLFQEKNVDGKVYGNVSHREQRPEQGPVSFLIKNIRRPLGVIHYSSYCTY